MNNITLRKIRIAIKARKRVIPSVFHLEKMVQNKLMKKRITNNVTLFTETENVVRKHPVSPTAVKYRHKNGTAKEKNKFSFPIFSLQKSIVVILTFSFCGVLIRYLHSVPDIQYIGFRLLSIFQIFIYDRLIIYDVLIRFHGSKFPYGLIDILILFYQHLM